MPRKIAVPPATNWLNCSNVASTTSYSVPAFAPTIPAARQLVSHGQFQLNGKLVTIPSIRIRIGDSFGPSD